MAVQIGPGKSWKKA